MLFRWIVCDKNSCSFFREGQLNREGYNTFGIKPIASGCEVDEAGRLINADALALQKASSIKRSYATINPVALEQPIAPHLAAKELGVTVHAEEVLEKLSYSIQSEADINLIEGVGGWSVPLNNDEKVSDLVCALNIPVILVVGIKLGCINHALLTVESILQSQVPFLGWVANAIDPSVLAFQGNIETLKREIPAACLGVLPYNSHLSSHGIQLDMNSILNYFSERKVEKLI